MLGNPSEKHRRMSVLELGSMSRWSEIRKSNKLIDQGAHLNRTALEMARHELEQRSLEVIGEVGQLVRKVSRRSLRSRRSRRSAPSSSEDNEGTTDVGLGHDHSAVLLDPFVERKRVHGQVVREEAEEGPAADRIELYNYKLDRPQEPQSPVTVESQPHTGFEEQDTKGGWHTPKEHMTKEEIGDNDGSSPASASQARPINPEGLKKRLEHESASVNGAKMAETEESREDTSRVDDNKGKQPDVDEASEAEGQSRRHSKDKQD